MMATRPQPGGAQALPPIDALAAVIQATRNLGGEGFTLEEARSRAWQSATMHGANIELRFRYCQRHAAKAAERFIRRVGSANVDMAGHLLAGVDAERRGALVIMRALTIEDS